jgi:hypothetical protein
MLLDVDVIDSPLDYKILLGCSFMYVMKFFTSLIFHTMSFPQNEKLATIDQITYHDPKFQLNPNNVVPSLDGNQTIASFFDISPRVYKYSTLLGVY